MLFSKAERAIKRQYKDATSVRFSCAYLFRIKVGDEYLLTRDEQGRGMFQPVGGVYKYTDDSFFDETKAIQCTRFGNTSDLDSDLRIIVPREKVKRFERWYREEKGRETPDDLYREFQEEILDRIPFLDETAFETLKYRYIGEHIQASRWKNKNVQIHIADIVELIPTRQQQQELLRLKDHESYFYRFATAAEIYDHGCTASHQAMSISPHTIKMLEGEEGSLSKNKRSGREISCHRPPAQAGAAKCDWVGLTKTDMEKPFTFISYQSDHSNVVWDFCKSNNPPLCNIWIDKKEVGGHWIEDLKKAIETGNCKKALLFVSLRYLIRSTPCYEEATLVVKNGIPHIVVLVDLDSVDVKQIIQNWINSDGADKEKLKVFKELLHYNDNTAHFDGTMLPLTNVNADWFLQVFENLEQAAVQDQPIP